MGSASVLPGAGRLCLGSRPLVEGVEISVVAINCCRLDARAAPVLRPDACKLRSGLEVYFLINRSGLATRRSPEHTRSALAPRG